MRNEEIRMGYIITHHLLAGYAVVRRNKDRKKEKTKKRHRPDFTRWDADRGGKNAHFFSIVCRDVREMRVGIQSKGDALTERYTLLRHAAYAAAVALLRVVGVPVRSECPSPS